jgi:Protein of unknown function (DUF2442)
MLKITQAEISQHPFKYKLKFSDLRVGEIDARALIREPQPNIFSRLAAPDFSASAKLAHGTLCWPGELDVAPEYLYFLAFKDAPELQQQFQDWGYAASAS